jgi:hypothetical protein
MQALRALTLAAVCSLGLFGVHVAAQDDGEDARDDAETDVTEVDAASIPPTAEEGCFNVREVRNFDALSNEFVFVEGRGDEMFLLTMFSNCIGLRDSFEIAIQSRMSRVCSNSSADIRYRGLDRGLDTCQIVKVEKVDDKAAAEALAESRSRN